MLKKVLVISGVIVLCLVCGATGWWLSQRTLDDESDFLSPILKLEKPKPLQAYSIPALTQRSYQKSPLKIEKILTQTPEYTGYLFSYKTLNKKVTGQLNVPTTPLADPTPTIVMLRGYVPVESYTTGVGTKNAAKVYAENGFITVSPDFLGYGESDPEPSDTWQARFEKPIIVIELLKSLENMKLTIDPTQFAEAKPGQRQPEPATITFGKLGLWGHSNGGQIALTTLEILQQPIPTTLWAPVTAPFPYSILFFSDESEDEGKAMRKWVSIFEDDYNVFDFSLTQHLDALRGPLQLHHGTADEAALISWSEEFMTKLKAENKRRENESEKLATQSAKPPIPAALSLIDITYFTYPGADHNLQPGWDKVVQRDLEFYKKHLGVGL